MNYPQHNLPLKYTQRPVLTMSNINHMGEMQQQQQQQQQQQAVINTVQHTANSQSSSSSKLHRYFNSSQYLSTQQQLAVFIQGFPIIDIKSQHKSINDIIPLLIKQNQLLAKKCHSQILLIKQSFTKHQSINKQYKSIKQQIQNTRTQCQIIINQKDLQLVKVNSEIDQLKNAITTYQEFIVVQNGVFRQLLSGEFKKVEDMIATRAVKQKYMSFLQMVTNKSANQPTSLLKQDTFLSLNTIQKHNKQHKRKAKYISKVKQSVDQFCSRLIKITQIVPPQIITKQLKYECHQFADIIAELIGNGEGKRKREKSQAYMRGGGEMEGVGNNLRGNGNNMNNSNSNSNGHTDSNNNNNSNSNNTVNSPRFTQRQTISLRSYANSNNNSSPFELMLSAYISQTTKNYSQQLSLLQSQLHQLHQQLNKSKQQQSTAKQYYQSHLIQAKAQYEKQKRQLKQELTIKDQMARHYQEQLQKCFSAKQELQNRLLLLNKQNEQLTQQYNPKARQVQMLQQQLSQKQQLISKLRQKLKIVQNQHNQLITYKQKQHKQALHKLQQRLKQQQHQHQSQLTNKCIIVKQRQQQITQLNANIRELKQAIQDKTLEVNRANKKLYGIEQNQLRLLSSKVQSLQKQAVQMKKSNKHLHKTIQQLHHEISLNTSYIHQLESKSQKKDQAIDKLNKKLSSSEMDKKGNNKLKQINQLLQQQLGQSSNQLNKAMEQNSNLKKLVKQMKKQLQSVYHTINDLKTIQRDREKLVVQSQKSQRWRQQIIKDYDQMKFEILKVQSQNKSLLLELRHYKNALKRIQMIQ